MTLWKCRRADAPGVARILAESCIVVFLAAVVQSVHVPVPLVGALVPVTVAVGALRVDHRHPHRVQVERIPCLLDEQVDVLIGAGESVPDGGGHGVGLVPDYVRPQYPLTLLHTDGEAGGDLEELLVPHPAVTRARQHWALQVARVLVGTAAVAVCSPVRVPQVHEAGARRLEHPPHLVEARPEVLQVERGVRLQAELTVYPVVAQSPVSKGD